jgi:hypothetical protein
MGTAIVPDETVVGVDVTDALSATLPPGHIEAEDGVIIGGDGETFTVNVAGFDISGNPPCEQVTTTRYSYPAIASVAPVIVNVAVVTPE